MSGVRISRQQWEGLLGELDVARRQRHLLTYRALLERLELPSPAMQTLTAALEYLAVLDARMDEVYACTYHHDGQRWHAQGECVVCAPEAVEAPAGYTVAGHAQAVYGARLAPDAPHVPARPEADALLRLAPEALARAVDTSPGAAQPLYVRNKVAFTTEERALRAAAKEAVAPATPSGGSTP